MNQMGTQCYFRRFAERPAAVGGRAIRQRVKLGGQNFPAVVQLGFAEVAKVCRGEPQRRGVVRNSPPCQVDVGVLAGSLFCFLFFNEQ